MDRKGFLQQLTLIGGGTLVVPSVLFQSCKPEPRVWSSLSSNDVDVLNALGETILPKTESLPGAKEINVGQYVVQTVNACLSHEDKNTFLNGLTSIEALSIHEFGKSFEDLGGENKLTLLKSLQDEALSFEEQQEGALEPEIHYFSLLKDLVLTGYFTSKEVMTGAFNYTPIPGRYEGCLDFDPQSDKIYKG